MFSGEGSSVAWFKLAEFVGRKEKERAFSIYRLLAHSLHNDALSAQLEGDLYAAFQDDRAYEAYVRAAQLYERQQAIDHAIEMYRQLIVRKPADKLSWAHYVRLCTARKLYEQIAQTAYQTIKELLMHDALGLAVMYVQDTVKVLSLAHESPQQLGRFLARIEFTHPACIDAARELLNKDFSTTI